MYTTRVYIEDTKEKFDIGEKSGINTDNNQMELPPNPTMVGGTPNFVLGYNPLSYYKDMKLIDLV